MRAGFSRATASYAFQAPFLLKRPPSRKRAIVPFNSLLFWGMTRLQRINHGFGVCNIDGLHICETAESDNLRVHFLKRSVRIEQALP